MKRLFSFKKMSVKIAFVVAAVVVIVGGGATFYMQTRIIEEIDNHARMYVRYRIREAADDVGISIVEGLEISRVADIVNRVRLYNTGFAALVDNRGEFIEPSGLIGNLTANEKLILRNLAMASQNETFDIRLSNIAYTAARVELANEYSLFVFAPRNEVMAEVNASLVRFAIIFASVLTLVIIISHFIGKSMAAPLVVLNKYMRKAAATGDITLSNEDMESLSGLLQQKDEIGQCVGATVDFFEHINNVSEKLETLSQGNLTANIDMRSEKDVLGKSLSHMIDRLNNIFGGIRASANQVSAGAKQIADGAQTLAQGSIEQAATVEELSASASGISQKTKVNAQITDKAAELAVTIKGNAEKGNRQMDDMVAAVNEISQASQSISQVIKVIDDIAFQTNILALNAAVEAARAGQHGKGFAVVADEVRTLAAKSAEAARDTGVLISNSMEKAQHGAHIAKNTAESLFEIVTGINESSEIISEIAMASEAQATGIAQINNGIEQVATIVQQNSATAEESAAASEELSGQSDMLEDLISQFRLKKPDATRSQAKQGLAAPENSSFALNAITRKH